MSSCDYSNSLQICAEGVIEVGITALIKAAEMPGYYTDEAVFFQLLLSLLFS